MTAISPKICPVQGVEHLPACVKLTEPSASRYMRWMLFLLNISWPIGFWKMLRFSDFSFSLNSVVPA
jgi:hypothetical protein